IGKSSLLTAGLADVAVLGCRILWATCDELDPRVAVQVLLERPAHDAGSRRPYDQVRAAGGPVPTSIEQLSAVVERMCARTAGAGPRRSAVGGRGESGRVACDEPAGAADAAAARRGVPSDPATTSDRAVTRGTRRQRRHRHQPRTAARRA